ncbi:MAG: hypothetical protein JXR44_06100 [Thiotrichales bacterium]|nr:hypothetical protein [Thiotrichales bacterium]
MHGMKLTSLAILIGGLIGCVPMGQQVSENTSGNNSISSPADIDLLIEKAKAEERQRLLQEQDKQKQQAEVFALLKQQQTQSEPVAVNDASIVGNIDGKVFKACREELKTAPRFEIIKERVLVEPEVTQQEFTPAEFKSIEKRIEIEPEQKVVDKVIPAKYETVTEEVVIAPARERWVEVPAEYEVRDVQIKVRDGYEEMRPCFRTSPGASLIDGEYKCLVQVPDEFKTVRQKQLVKAKSVKKEVIPAETKTITRKVLVKPEEIVYKTLPAKYKTITSQEQVTQAKSMQVTSAAKYETIEKRVPVGDAGKAMRKVVCKEDRDPALVERIQGVLAEKGYLKPSPPNDLEVVDGIWGPNTANTLYRYQRDNGLAEGAISFEVLHYMGIMK